MSLLKNNIAGLYLWFVELDGQENNDFGLWITTRTNSVSQAGKKAEKFLRQNKKEYPDAKISTIKAQGTLDA
jgi:hypothetical protein